MIHSLILAALQEAIDAEVLPGAIRPDQVHREELGARVHEPVEVEGCGEGHPDGHRNKRKYPHHSRKLACHRVSRAGVGAEDIEQRDDATHHWQNARRIWGRQIGEPQVPVREHGRAQNEVVGEFVYQRNIHKMHWELEHVQEVEHGVDAVISPH